MRWRLFGYQGPDSSHVGDVSGRITVCDGQIPRRRVLCIAVRHALHDGVVAVAVEHSGSSHSRSHLRDHHNQSLVQGAFQCIDADSHVWLGISRLSRG